MPSIRSVAHRARSRARAAARARLMALLDLSELRERLDQTDGQLRLLSAAHHETRTDLGRTAAEVDAVRGALATSVTDIDRRLASAHHDLEDVRRATGPLLRLSEIATTTTWIDLIQQPETLTVSVVMPTHNRVGVLPRSIASVLAQTYGRWELLIVDDGSTDETAALLTGYDDPRIRCFTADHAGCSGARNVALDHVRGDVVVYLDDDNIMHPNWLKSVVWAFTQRPDVEVLYAARIIDDLGRVDGDFGGGLLPFIQFEVFDRDALAQHNLVDIGALAHRAGLADARFDEQLVMFGDWDLLLRLTRHQDPLQLPVIAIGYATDAPDRLSDDQDEREAAIVQGKLSASTATSD